MKIEIFHDTVCPWCRIGKKNLFVALERWNEEPVEIVWRAFLLDPTLPEEGRDFRANMLAKMGSEEYLDKLFAYTERAGAAVGLRFDFNKLTHAPNSTLSHEIIALAPDDRRTALVDAITQAYFEEDANIGKADVLLEIATRVGIEISRADLEKHTALPLVQADVNQAHALGITGVPFFLLDGEYGVSGARSANDFLKIFQQVVESRKS